MTTKAAPIAGRPSSFTTITPPRPSTPQQWCNSGAAAVQAVQVAQASVPPLAFLRDGCYNAGVVGRPLRVPSRKLETGCFADGGGRIGRILAYAGLLELAGR